MGKFVSRVGRVSLRQRAVVASLQVEAVAGGKKTKDIATHQGITPRRALAVMRYAEDAGWVTSIRHPHRKNSFYFRWLSSGGSRGAIADELRADERATSQARVSAYFWSHHEAL